MKQPLRTGVIGLGLMGQGHSRLIQREPRTALVAVCDVLADRAAKLGTELGANPYADYREMLAKERLDLAIVSTPDGLHREPVIEAVRAGVRYIACQKPLATTVEDAAAMAEAADKAGTKLLVCLGNRTNPLDVAAHYAIQNGLIGDPSFGEARLDDNISVPTQMWGTRSHEWASTSSSAFFLLSHVTDLLRWYFAPAEVEGVQAFSRSKVLGYTPDVYDAYLYFDTGLAVRVKAEWVKEIEELVEFYLCFTGTAGTLVYNKLPGFGVSQGLAVYTRGMSPSDLELHQTSLLAKGIRSRLVRRHTRPGVGELDTRCSLELRLADQPASGKDIITYFVDAIEEGRDVPSTWEGNGGLPYALDGLKQTKIVQAIIDSARLRREIAIT